MSKALKEFTTSTGITVKIKGIPQMLLDKIQGSVDMPQPPMYEVKTASEESIFEPHNETTLQTDEDKAAYANFLRRVAERDNIIKERMLKVIAMRGLEVEMPKDTSWIDMQKFLGISIPEDPLELKYLYIITEVLGDTDDVMKITEMVMGATGVPEEALAEARKSFPGGLQKVPTTPKDGRSRKRKVDQ